MFKKTSVLLVLILTVILILPLGVQAGVIANYGDSVLPDDYVGSLMTPDEVIGYDGYAEPFGFRIGYAVTDETATTGKFKYHYTITSTLPDPDNTEKYLPLLKDISHLILELSIDVTEREFTITSNPPYDPEDLEGPRWFRTDDPGKSNPFLPNDMFGVKLEDFVDDSTVLELEVVIGRFPVWGNFYVADGTYLDVEGVAYNKGFENMEEAGYFIPVPDTKKVPEPGTLLLIGSLLIGLGLIKRKF